MHILDLGLMCAARAKTELMETRRPEIAKSGVGPTLRKLECYDSLGWSLEEQIENELGG
jgi:hypothetical protein